MNQNDNSSLRLMLGLQIDKLKEENAKQKEIIDKLMAKLNKFCEVYVDCQFELGEEFDRLTDIISEVGNGDDGQSFKNSEMGCS